MPAAPTPALGDVVLDDYANPAVIVSTGVNLGTPHARWSIMQTCGSDRGRITSAPTRDGLPIPANVSAEQAETTRAIVRDEARKRGYRWDSTGITR